MRRDPRRLMMIHPLRFPLLLIAIFCIVPTISHGAPVKTGAEVVAEERFQPLAGKKFGLITNHSAVVGGVELTKLLRAGGVAPAVIFTPEHGLEGRAEDGVRLGDGLVAGIPVKSLYGATRKPRPEDLKGLDLLVFDIQDIGARFYTYISTMGLAMQAAAEAHIPFLVLDRPNPLGGEYISGFVREELPPSFTSLYAIPVAHGMTVGELATMVKGEEMLPGVGELELGVVRMKGWHRAMRWPDTGLSFVGTSPNIDCFDACLFYPGTGLLEGTSASEGRGTKEPFRLVGWPGIDAQGVAERLTRLALPGVRFEAVHFTPVSMPGKSSAPRYRGKVVDGVRVTVTDYRQVLPVETGVAVLRELWEALPPELRKGFFRKGFDDMAGSGRLRQAVEAGAGARELFQLWDESLVGFERMRQRYLLY
ncbi:DUF1343 domain-containing protein [Geomonas sp. RF6]|uniref:exo-beta-N-acetylmuramidase NamZ family protein n=1 Tax=Geomonas sp. RF6 TaxID=2897342 RepID=UPI001E3AC099|nr:DUF1343 domain-containing protein [Geomonas sp. RF6]UFS69430.1 DUF1343 domain-containing protein [Geomonas sp. RF6]